MAKPKDQRLLNATSYSLLSVLSLLATYVHSAYLTKTRSWLFATPSDRPFGVPEWDPSAGPVIGVHWFGDLFDGHSTVKHSGEGGYFGASYLFYLVTQRTDFSVVVLTYFLLCLVLAAVSIRGWLRCVERDSHTLVYLLHFSYPIVFGMDRGQIHIPLIYMISIGMTAVATYTSVSKPDYRRQILLGAGFSMKLYPFIYFFVFPEFWNTRKWRVLILTLCSVVLTSLVLAPRGIQHLFYQLDSGSLYSTDDYLIATLPYNTSFRALLALLDLNTSWTSPIWVTLENAVLDWYSRIHAVLGAFVLVLAWKAKLSISERILVATILSNAFLPISAVYNQGLVAIAALVSLCNQSFRRRAQTVMFDVVVLASLIPLNLPLNFGQYDARIGTYQSVVVPTVQTIYLVGIVALGISSFRRRKHVLES